MSGASPAASADYAVGIVHYQSYELLDRCLASVEAQSLPAALRLEHAQGRTEIGPGLAVLYEEAERGELEAQHAGPL